MPATRPSIGRHAYQSRVKWLLTGVTIALLGVIGIAMLIIAVASVFFPDAEGVDFLLASIAAGTGAACIIGSLALMPFFRRPVDVPAGAAGLAGSTPLFVVRFRRTATARPSYQGKGILCCYPDHLIVEGYLARNPFILLGIVIAGLAAAMVEPGYGVGIIVGSVVADVIGREKTTQIFPYQIIWRFAVAGNQATMVCVVGRPAHIVFAFDPADAHRLHDVIATHMLAAEPEISPTAP